MAHGDVGDFGYVLKQGVSSCFCNIFFGGDCLVRFLVVLVVTFFKVSLGSLTIISLKLNSINTLNSIEIFKHLGNKNKRSWNIHLCFLASLISSNLPLNGSGKWITFSKWVACLQRWHFPPSRIVGKRVICFGNKSQIIHERYFYPHLGWSKR